MRCSFIAVPHPDWTFETGSLEQQRITRISGGSLTTSRLIDGKFICTILEPENPSSKIVKKMKMVGIFVVKETHA